MALGGGGWGKGGVRSTLSGVKGNGHFAGVTAVLWLDSPGQAIVVYRTRVVSTAATAGGL
jgi:hypothetical protein